MDLAQCHTLLSQYQAQNADLRNRLYADFEQRATHARSPHPMALLIIGAALGAVVAVVVLHLWRGKAVA